MLTEDDHAKIIDFGLAKLLVPLGSSDSLDDTALRQTESGKIWGTVSYTSPEQARGKTLDQMTHPSAPEDSVDWNEKELLERNAVGSDQ